MRKAVVGVILAILVAAGLGVGYLAVNSGRQTSTSISTTSQTTSRSTLSTEESAGSMISTLPLSGLELRIGLNATSMLAGHTLAANVILFNTLNQSLTLSPFSPANSTNSVQAWADYDFLCGYDDPVGCLASFAVFPGSISAGNLSQAPSPLQIAPQAGLPSSIGTVFPENTTITFMPDSDNVSVPGTGGGVVSTYQEPASLDVTTTACIALPSGSPECHGGTGLYGYWIASSTTICCPANSSVQKLFRYLTPGQYTLAAEDVWGQSLFAHFQVLPGPSPVESVGNQESPFSGPDSPVIGITLANLGDVPISSVGAVLRFVPAANNNTSSASYPFAFVVNSTDPLLPGQVVQDVRTLQGNPFGIGVNYPLTISGTFSNGTAFTYTQQVQFRNTVPSS
jgi:hypothetical protein